MQIMDMLFAIRVGGNVEQVWYKLFHLHDLSTDL
jgi:hypothetical protein